MGGHRMAYGLRVFLLVAAVVVLAAAAAAAVIFFPGGSARKAPPPVSAAFVTPSPTPDPTPTPTPSPTPEPTPTPLPTVPLSDMLEPDLDALREQNSDVYAWLDIPGMNVSYPLLQSDEDNYYLMRNLDGSGGYPGCLYTNSCCARDFSGFNAIIYGHNMIDGSMFGSLDKYFDEDFFNDHRHVVIYTPEEVLVYRMISVSVFDDYYIPATYDFFAEESDRQAFLDDIRDRAYIFAADVTAGVDDRLITLSTCNGNSATRDVFVAVYEGQGVPG